MLFDYKTFYKKIYIGDLYLVIGHENCVYHPIDKIVELAIKGGVTIVQLREKRLNTRDFINQAKFIKGITQKYNIPFIINDRIDIALAIDADGVHLGQSDMPYKMAREILGNNKIIGISVETPADILEIGLSCADYISVSPVFDTTTKLDTSLAWKFDGVTYARSKIKQRIVGIGDMNPKNIERVLLAGADTIALISPITSSKNPYKTTLEINKLITRVKSRIRRNY